MKKCSAVLALFFLTFTLYAQSVWTGNASVGGSSVFPGKSDVFRAASNSFPVGTVLKVTNPRGGAEVDVTVTGRLESPGVFILIEEAAAEFIGLPDDHVLPVRVTPVSRVAVPEEENPPEGKDELTVDTDYNPAAGLAEKNDKKIIDEAAAVKAPEEETVEADAPAEVESAGTAADETPEKETIITYDLSAEDEKKSEESPADEKSGGTIYFLTPSDLRPPEVAEADEVELPGSPVLSESEPASPAVSDLPLYDADSRLSYIQVGAYSSRIILEDTMKDLQRIAPGYPLSVDTAGSKDGTVYKLLIGPLSPAETGIVLKTARSTSFPDAFPYRP